MLTSKTGATITPSSFVYEEPDSSLAYAEYFDQDGRVVGEITQSPSAKKYKARTRNNTPTPVRRSFREAEADLLNAL